MPKLSSISVGVPGIEVADGVAGDFRVTVRHEDFTEAHATVAHRGNSTTLTVTGTNEAHVAHAAKWMEKAILNMHHVGMIDPE